ncbi:hypothetical protein NFJ49_03545 [Citrobacter braakii]|uniref:hypothetical protein n=1 Tax=Citrobacter braakii TaxID=57706 RepID=UPI002433EB80|nr:hypothetical protein [Citrobacter braakii]WFV81966.1 hypothetical protein NFJ49_03545 [Citrobacter braakii]
MIWFLLNVCSLKLEYSSSGFRLPASGFRLPASGFRLQPDLGTEVIYFSEKQSAWEFGKTLALNSPSGMNDNGIA